MISNHIKSCRLIRSECSHNSIFYEGFLVGRAIVSGHQLSKDFQLFAKIQSLSPRNCRCVLYEFLDLSPIILYEDGDFTAPGTLLGDVDFAAEEPLLDEDVDEVEVCSSVGVEKASILSELATTVKVDDITDFELVGCFPDFSVVMRLSTAETVAVTFAPAFDFAFLFPKSLASSAANSFTVTTVMDRPISWGLLLHSVQSSPIFQWKVVC